MPGAFSPTEVLAAWEAGADIVKIFPSEITGPAYLNALSGPLPQIRLMPTGGVNLETAPAFLRRRRFCPRCWQFAGRPQVGRLRSTRPDRTARRSVCRSRAGDSRELASSLGATARRLASLVGQRLAVASHQGGPKLPGFSSPVGR